MARRKGQGRKRPARVKVAIVGGAALGWGPTIVTDLALNEDLAGQIVLHDIDPKPLSLMRRYGRAVCRHPDAGGRFELTTTQDRRKALRDADFVVVTISVGGLAMMAHDLRIPRKYGIVQSVGDTVGPGGLFRALRNVPVFKRIAEDILRCCPNAWVLSYTNPCTMLARTLIRHGVKAIGCCHEVFGAKSLIAQLANQTLGRKDLTRDDVDAVVTGINHCTVFTHATVAGRDALDMVRRHMKQPGVVRVYGPGEQLQAQGLFARDQVKLELLRRYGALGAAGDRHLAEFFPGYLTPETHEGNRWGVVVTTIDERIQWKKDDLAKIRARLRDAKAFARQPLKRSGEEAGDMMACLVGQRTMRTNVNRPNVGQIPNLPTDAVVETNAWLTFDRIDPICSGPLPDGLLPWYLRHVMNQESTIEAALKGDRDLAFQALLNDPLVSDRDDAERMFKEMLRVQADYLPEFKPRRKTRRPRRDPSKTAAVDGALACGLAYG
ncbi:MAG: alpha-glucosidase/alpha-galactosidase [Phycisphaerae bacterium]|nr:alpha-glucosidase/alpha-galactosidase [Phycisphaerae bacterium]